MPITKVRMGPNIPIGPGAVPQTPVAAPIMRAPGDYFLPGKPVPVAIEKDTALGANETVIVQGEIFIVGINDDAVIQAAAEWKAQKLESKLANLDGGQLPYVCFVRFWARAKELGCSPLDLGEMNEVAAKLQNTEESVGVMLRLCKAYGVDTKTVQFHDQTLSEISTAPWAKPLRVPTIQPPVGGWPLIAEAVAPVGAGAVTAVSDRYAGLNTASDRALVDVFSRDNIGDYSMWSGFASWFARAIELGVKEGRVSDWSKVVARSKNTPGDAAKLLRLAIALKKDPATIDFHGRKLSEVRSAMPPFWHKQYIANTGADEALAELNALSGLAEVKQAIEEIKTCLEINLLRKQQGLPVLQPSLHTSFTGKPGTGKTTVARIYAKILHGLGVITKPDIVEVDRAALVGQFNGETAERTLEVLKKGKGGVVFIDEAYTLGQGGENDAGKEAVATILKFMEDNRHDTVVVFAGYTNEMRRLFDVNPGLRSRVQQHIEFADFDDSVLRQILGTMAVTAGYSIDSAVLDRAVDHVSSARNRKDFANGRTIRNMFEAAVKTQSLRLKQATSDPLFIANNAFLREVTEADLLGAEAGNKSTADDAIKRLDALDGLAEAKAKIKKIRHLIATNKMRQKQGLSVTQPSLHASFLGGPGTGKTTVARLYAEALAGVGALSKGHLVEVDRAGLVGGFIGQTESKTKDVLESALGGVLFIDEAYALADGGDNDYGKTALATILKFMEDHRDDISVVFAGYPNEMQKLYALNPGLKSRIANDIPFADYDQAALGRILQKLATSMGYTVDEQVVQKVAAKIDKERALPDFANARSVRNAIEAAIFEQGERIQRKFDETAETPDTSELMRLSVEDFGGGGGLG